MAAYRSELLTAKLERRCQSSVESPPSPFLFFHNLSKPKRVLQDEQFAQPPRSFIGNTTIQTIERTIAQELKFFHE